MRDVLTCCSGTLEGQLRPAFPRFMAIKRNLNRPSIEKITVHACRDEVGDMHGLWDAVADGGWLRGAAGRKTRTPALHDGVGDIRGLWRRLKASCCRETAMALQDWSLTTQRSSLVAESPSGTVLPAGPNGLVAAASVSHYHIIGKHLLGNAATAAAAAAAFPFAAPSLLRLLPASSSPSCRLVVCPRLALWCLPLFRVSVL